GDDDRVAHDERRAGDAPHRDVDVDVGRRVARPDHRTRDGIEGIQDAGRAQRVDAAVAESRRASRPRAAVRFPEARRVAMPPDRSARALSIAGDDLVAAALLLRVDEIAVDGERRPAGPDGPAPEPGPP